MPARVRVQLAEIGNQQGRGLAETAAECEAAATILDAAGDLEGLAEAWLLIGELRHWLGESPANKEALEHARDYARRGGNHRLAMESSSWLVLTSTALAKPVPADAAIDRAEQLLKVASGDPWAESAILEGLSLLYGYAGRFAPCALGGYTRPVDVPPMGGEPWLGSQRHRGLAEIVTGLRAAEAAAFHMLLDASDDVLRRRIEASAKARHWRLGHLTEHRQARGWLRHEADLVLDTTGLTAGQAARAIAALPRACRPGCRS